MNYIWFLLILLSFIFAIANGKISDLSISVTNSIKTAIELSITIVGVMTFWMGIMKIAEKSGIVGFIAKILNPVAKVIFPEITDNDEGKEIVGNVAFNFTANAFGLANAATPMGIKAIKGMQKINIDKNSASNSMCMLLAMNTAGFQLIPITVIAVLANFGADNPSEIILPTLIVTTISFIFAIIVAKILSKMWKPQVITNDEVENNE